VPLIAASGLGVSLAAAVFYDSFTTSVLTWTSTVVIANSYGTVEGAHGASTGLRCGAG